MMTRDEMIEAGARALRATFYPNRRIRETPEDEWKRRAAAVVDAIHPAPTEPDRCPTCESRRHDMRLWNCIYNPDPWHQGADR